MHNSIKTFTLTTVLALSALSVTSFSIAQNNLNMGERDNHQKMQHNPMLHLIKSLNLTPDQQDQIKVIMQNNRPDQSSGRPNEEERQIHEANVHKQIESVLTDEQQIEFQTLIENRHTKHQARQL